MKIFESLAEDQHEQIIFCSDKVAKLRGIIAIHDTTLGPAIGGVRMFPYKSDDEALKDVLLLSKAMTYKAAAAGINLGGGQGVVIGNPSEDKNELLLRAFGRFVQGLHGRYITAEDVGTTVEDMEIVRYETNFVVGLSRALGGSGDPGPVTAIGLCNGILACVEKVMHKRSLRDVTVAIQGMGHVGYHLAQRLKKEGCKLIVADIIKDKAEKAKDELDAEIVPPEKIFQVKADVFSPCALGGVINSETVEQLKAKIIAGAANNQLVDDAFGDILHKKGILYAPDFVIGAGGMINVANELGGYVREKAIKQATGIYDIMKKILDISDESDIPTYKAANILAKARIAEVKKFRQRHA